MPGRALPNIIVPTKGRLALPYNTMYTIVRTKYKYTIVHAEYTHTIVCAEYKYIIVHTEYKHTIVQCTMCTKSISARL